MGRLRTRLHPSSVAIASVVVASLAACAGGQKAALAPSRSVSAADAKVEAKVEAKQTAEGNTHLEVAVEHLAPPQTVAPDASTYVVWAMPAATGGEHVENLGALSIGDERKGELKAFTPLQSFDVLVTPEASAKVQTPSHEVVLSARIWMPAQ